MKRFFPAVAAALASALLSVALSGCGGGAGGAAPAPVLEPPQSPPPAPGASFTADLVPLVRSAPESAEPAEVDGVMPSTSDGDEPVAVE